MPVRVSLSFLHERIKNDTDVVAFSDCITTQKYMGFTRNNVMWRLCSNGLRKVSVNNFSTT